MSLLWDGLELQPAHGRWRFWVEQGRDELPESRDYSDLVPFRRGRLHRPSTADRRMVELKGYIQEATLAAFRTQTDTLKGLLDPERATPALLVDTMEDGSQRWIEAVPRNLIAAYGGNATRLMSVELEALDPYWYGAYAPATLDSGLFFDAGWLLDEGAWIAVTPTSVTHGVAFTNPGTADVDRVRVEFTGPSTAPPGIAVDTPDGVVGFIAGATLATGQVLALDNFARTVAIAGVSQRAGLVLNDANKHGEYVHFVPGANTVRILGQPAAARIHFLPTYS